MFLIVNTPHKIDDDDDDDDDDDSGQFSSVKFINALC
jgi:hypothetical protein